MVYMYFREPSTIFVELVLLCKTSLRNFNTIMKDFLSCHNVVNQSVCLDEVHPILQLTVEVLDI